MLKNMEQDTKADREKLKTNKQKKLGVEVGDLLTRRKVEKSENRDRKFTGDTPS